MSSRRPRAARGAATPFPIEWTRRAKVTTLRELHDRVTQKSPISMLNPWMAQHQRDVLNALRASGSGSPALREELANYRQQVKALREQLSKTRDAKDDTKDDADAALQAAVAEEQRRVEALETQLTKTRREAADGLEESAVAVRRLEQRVDELLVEAEAAEGIGQEQLEEARARLDDETKWLAKARQALSVLRLEEGARVSEEDELKQDLSEATDKLREATAEIARLSGVLSRLQERESGL